jgi:hypothetical protein
LHNGTVMQCMKSTSECHENCFDDSAINTFSAGASVAFLLMATTKGAAPFVWPENHYIIFSKTYHSHHREDPNFTLNIARRPTLIRIDDRIWITVTVSYLIYNLHNTVTQRSICVVQLRKPVKVRY